MSVDLENLVVATGLEKVSFHSKPKERQCQRMFKLAQLHSSHMLAKSCSKSFKLGQQFVNRELPDVQAGLEKVEEPEIKLPTPVGS